MVKSVLIALCLCVGLQAQSSGRPKAWHRGLPDDGVISVSRIGQGKVTRELFNEAWLAFRTQYYLDARGAFTPQKRTLSMIRLAERRIYEYGNESVAPRILEFNVIGNADQDGRPIDGYYLVSRVGAPGRRSGTVDARFRDSSANSSPSIRLFVSDRSVIRRGTFSTDVDATGSNPYDPRFMVSGGDLREFAPMPDTKELQESFLESLKAGSVFKIVLFKHAVCPCRSQLVYVTDCSACKGKGGAEFPHLLSLVK
jgi:hypothetical protein